MPIAELSDQESSFFEIDGGPAMRTLIVGPVPTPPTPANQQFAVTIAAIFTIRSQPVDLYGDTEVEAPEPQMLCLTRDLEGVKSKMTVRFLGLVEGEDGYGKTYEVTPRIARAGANMSRVFLKEV